MITALSVSLGMIAAVCAYGAGAYAMHAQGTSIALLVSGAVLLYLIAVAAVTVLWFAIAWIWRADRPPEARLDARRTLRLLVQEYVTLLGSGFRMGVGWWFMREPMPGGDGRPVLLVHGVLCNSGVWLGMRGALRRRGIGPIFTISYGPPFSSIDEFAEQLACKVDAIVAQTGAPNVSIVAHSMGGLVARAYLRRHGAGRIDRVITIGTPHAGSVHAWLCPGTSLAQLRGRNPWLTALNAEPLPSVPLVSIWSWHDSMVAPQNSARLAGAENIALAGIGHNALLRDPGVFDLVAAILRGADPAAAREAAPRTTAAPTSGSPASAARTPSAPG